MTRRSRPAPARRTSIATAGVRRLAALLVLLTLLGACGGRRGEPETGAGGPSRSSGGGAAPVDTTAGGRWYGYEGGLEEAEAAARAIAGATQYWREVRGDWRTDTDSGTFVAHFLENRLRRAAITYGAGALTGTGAYTYDEQARLFHYGGEEKRRTGRGRQARTTTTTISVALDMRGTASATSKRVGRQRQSLTAEEVAKIWTREGVVRAAAVAAARQR